MFKTIVRQQKLNTYPTNLLKAGKFRKEKKGKCLQFHPQQQRRMFFFNADGQSRVDTTHICHQNQKNGYQSMRSRPAPLKIVATSKSSIRDRMVARGQQMIESEYLSVTSIKVEFNIPKTVGEYNTREQFVQLLDLLKKEDPTLKVQSSAHQVPEWTNFAQLPEEADFTDTFKLVTREFKSHQKVILHRKVITTKTFNRIKYSNRVKEYIFEQNIWIKIDQYDTKTEGSPVFS